MKLIPKNWSQFQHYKDRCPPWIKLHRGLLNDRAYMCLPLASKALAPLLWLLASESQDGVFDASIEELTFRLRMPESDIKAGIKALIEKGFFVDASTMLAPSSHDAFPEGEERQRTEAENRGRGRADSAAVPAAVPAPRAVRKIDDEKLEETFARFWAVYDHKVGRHKALKVWKQINPDDELVETILKAAARYSRANPDRVYYKHPSTWLTNRHWEDDPGAVKPRIAQPAPVTQQRPASYGAGLAIFGNLEKAHERSRVIDIETPAGLLGAEDI